MHKKSKIFYGMVCFFVTFLSCLQASDLNLRNGFIPDQDNFVLKYQEPSQLQQAVYEGNIALVQSLLLTSTDEVNAQDRCGRSLLHLVVDSRYGEMKYDRERQLYSRDCAADIAIKSVLIPLLLQAGVDSSLVNCHGKRAADCEFNSDVKNLLSGK